MSDLLKSLKDTKIQLLVVLILTFLVYANSLPNRLLWDDHLFLEQWPQIQSFQNLGEILKGSAPPAQGKIYRPLRGVFYMVDYQLWGSNPLGYRVQAILIHLISTLLVYFITRQLISQATHLGGEKNAVTPPRWILGAGHYLPFITALLFGRHPIHTETIDYISTSMESFGTVFFFLSFWLYLLFRRHTSEEFTSKVKEMGLHLRGVILGASVISAALAFFTYEMTLTLPMLIVLYEICFRFPLRAIRLRLRARSYLKVVPYFAIALTFVAIRFSVLGLLSRTDYLGYSFYLTQLTMVKVFVRYIGLLFFPINQTAIHNLVGDFPSSMTPYDKLGPILNQTIFDADVLLSIAVIAALLLAAVKYIRKYPIISFSILWFFISLLPVSYIIPHGGAMAEKYLYIPSFGFLLLISHLGGVIFSSSPGWITKKFFQQLLIFMLILLLVVYSGLTFARNIVWRDDISLFSDVVKKSPGNLLANYTLGIWFGNFNALGEAEKYYRAVLDKAPDFWQAHMNLGNIYLRAAVLEKAAEEYQTALNLNPNLKAASNTLKNLSLVKASTDSAQIYGNDVFAKFKKENRFEFFFPSYWSIEDGGKIIIKDQDGQFFVEFEEAAKPAKMKINDFLDKQASPAGMLVNQGLARIPNFQTAYVRVFDDNGVSRLQFFLVQDEKVIKILAYPANSPQMRLFDIILGSIKI